jgi:thiosulfate dehydrogenase [quinone] large subunit
MSENNVYARNSLITLRIMIGWHFLYEGIVKLYDPNWTSKGYLLSSKGPFQGFFQWLAGEHLIGAIDMANMLALTLVGLLLILGLWERVGALMGMALLILYYLAYPPFPGIEQIGAEGNYWIVNKNLIEAAALWVLWQFPTGSIFGIERWLKISIDK